MTIRRLFLIMILFNLFGTALKASESTVADSSVNKKGGLTNKLNKENVICIDEYKVGVEEFSERLNFAPTLREFSSDTERKQDIAASVIAGKILADEATKKNLDTAVNVKATVDEYEKEAVYEYWMDKEITEKIRITDPEMVKAYPKFIEERIVDYLVFPDQYSAKTALAEIKNGKKFSSFKSKDSKPVMQTKTIEFGESLPNVEDAVYSLKAGQTSQVIPIDGQYYIFNLSKAVPHPQYSKQNFDYWKPALEKRLKERKTARGFETIMPGLMKGKKFTVNKKIYEYVLNALAGRLSFDPEKLKLPEAVNQELAVVPVNIEFSFSESFMKFEDGSNWTVGDLWHKLRFGPYLLNYSSEKEFREDFPHLLRVAVIMETVMNDGYKKGYNNSDYVNEQTRMWKDDLLSKIYLYELGRGITVSDNEMKDYYNGNSAKYKVPEMCRIQEILTSDEKLAESLVNRINSGENMAVLSRKYSVRKLSGKESEEGIFIARNTWGKIGDIAFSLKPGQIYGPIKLEDGKYSVIKLLEYVSDRVKPYEEARSEISSELKKERLQSLMRQILSESVTKHKININKENLKKIELIEGSMLVRKSHFPNRSAVPLPIDINHKEKWFQDLWNRQ